jgi:penicillin-binding protein 2
LAAHVVGYLTEVNEKWVGKCPDGSEPADEAARLAAYRLGDLRGAAGLEASMEGRLRGVRGSVTRERSGRLLQRLDPVVGSDVTLTLDAAFQSEVEAFLGRPPNLPTDCGVARGAAVVIDLRTGGILALASTPRFDPNTLADDYADLTAEGAGDPFVHRAIAARLSLGSIYKIIAATAALHEGLIDEGTTFYCQGCLDPRDPEHFRCLGIHNEIALHDAMRKSCNVYFYHVGMLLGSRRLTEWGRRFGLGSRCGLLLPGEGAGSLPDGIDPRNLAVGQGLLAVTPLQVARMAALVATNGRMNEIHIVQSPRAQPVGRVELDLKPSLMAIVRRGLKGVVNEIGGTGYSSARSLLVEIAGKTGTAQSGLKDKDHSWFVGYAPADDPQIAFAVVLEHAGKGSTVAGPVARQIVETALRQNLITAN